MGLGSVLQGDVYMLVFRQDSGCVCGRDRPACCEQQLLLSVASTYDAESVAFGSSTRVLDCPPQQAGASDSRS
jgi:hypothetical protein